MQVDAFGKIEESLSVRVTDVKMDKDLSAQVYDHFSQHNRGNRYGNNNNNRDYNNRDYNNNYRDDRSYNDNSMNDTVSVGTFLSSQK